MSLGIKLARRRAGLSLRVAAIALASACSDRVQTTAVIPDTARIRPPVDTAHLDAADHRPNIVFLLADDMRSDVIGAHGNSISQTPNLDALARQGVSFRNAYVTTPVCAI